jgi:hypothetical protein
MSILTPGCVLLVWVLPWPMVRLPAIDLLFELPMGFRRDDPKLFAG